MSYDYDDDGTEQTNTGNRGGGLRAQLEAALAELKQVKEQNDSLASRVKQSDLSTLLSERKVPAHIQKWMRDVEPTATAVDKWIAENGSDFGWKPGSESTEPARTQEGQQVTPEEAPAAPAVPSILTPEDAAALERLASILGQGQTRLADQQATAVQSVADNLGGELDFDKAVAGLKAQGIDIGSGT